MGRNFRKRVTTQGADASPPSEAWLFAQALLGKAAPSPSRAAAAVQAKREQLEWLAQISPRHQQELQRLRSAEAEARRERELLEWLTKISSRHERKLRNLLSEEAEARESQRRAERLAEALLEGNWDPSKHPKGAFPQNRGWFSPTGGSGSGSGTPPSQIVLNAIARPTPSRASAKSQGGVHTGDSASPFHLLGDGAKGSGQSPFRLASASSKDHAIAQAAAKGDLARLQDLISSGGLSAAERKAAQAAINRLTSTAQTIISKELKGGVTREFPSEMLKMKLKDIMDLATGTGPLAGKAKKALKLLRDNRFKK